jgi:maltooligosyltrehalose trehalohydrolase
MHINTLERTVGINFNNGNAVIQVWAPFASSLSVETQNKNQIKLIKSRKGWWKAKSDSINPGERYKINIDGNSFADPASLSQPDGVHQASETIDLKEIRKIRDVEWKGIAVKDLIIYELHTGTFTAEGTFDGIVKKLDYLKNLGVNAIELMPVISFPGRRNWGYDGAYPFAVHSAYGGAAKLADLVKACHQNGMAVILDVVYNHLGPEGNYLGEFGPYFTRKYNTPWGNAVNFDDAWCDAVRQFFIENALMWMRDFNIDGLRLDAVHAIKDFSPKHLLAELSENVQALNENTGKSHFLIAEVDLNDNRFIRSLKEGGFGMNAQWCDEWHHALHAVLTGEKSGYYSDFGDIEQLSDSFRNAYVFTGEYSEHRKKNFGTPTTGLSGDKFVIFTQNHDHTGNRMLGERLSQLLDFESLKLAAGAMLLSPFVPLLFMGEEYAEDAPFLYFIDHGDKDLVEAVRKGRKEEFSAFIKDAEPPDPASEETFMKSKLKWDFEKNERKARMLDFYKKLISLKKDLPLLKPGDRNLILVRNIQDSIILKYLSDKESLIVVMNYSSNEVSLEVDELQNPTAETIIYSSHKQWGGSAELSHNPILEINGKFLLQMKERSVILLKLPVQ